jgi:hypothetical protein
MDWVTKLGKKQTSYVSEEAEKLRKCSLASFKIPKDLIIYNFTTSETINLTLINTGDVSLHDFTFTIVTDMFSQPKSYIYKPITQRTRANPLKSGETWSVTLLPVNSAPSSQEELSEIFASAICQSDFVITHETSFE